MRETGGRMVNVTSRNRVARPEEIAAAAVYLASPEAEWPAGPSST
jgi:NAD(P)-dependent dehydrogenase (short-subunit alcohol dehydrogenase family)